MTKTAKVVHWTLLASLVYCIGTYVAAGMNGGWIEVFAIIFWSFLAFMVHQRPRSWGFWAGLFLLLVIPAQAWLWNLGVTRLSPEQRAAQGISGSWVAFWLSEIPFLIGSICGIALRWLCPAQEKQPHA